MGDAKVSLQDVGYSSVGVDEGWEGCGQGVNHTQHYVNGTPAVNSKFPDMKAMVDYGHKKNLKVGFYQVRETTKAVTKGCARILA